MLPLKKDGKLHQDAKTCYICEKIFRKSLLNMKIIEKRDTIVMLLVNTEVQHIVYAI